MLRLPKGVPLFEKLDASNLQLDAVVLKLKNGCFTGYASITFDQANSVLVFESGKLISALFENSADVRYNSFEALNALAEQMAAGSSSVLNVYRLSGDLTLCVHALLQGEVRYCGQALGLIDIKNLLERIKSEQMNCCLRIYTADHSSMIFYKGGEPLGFFHDGSEEIEASPGNSQQLTQDPAAKLDLYSTAGIDELMPQDLLEMFNIDSIWKSAVSKQQARLSGS